MKAKYRHDYEMFTPAGNRACQRVVARLLKRSNELDTPEKLTAATRGQMDCVAIKHAEIWDTEPRDYIFSDAVKRIAAYHGFENEVSRFM